MKGMPKDETIEKWIKNYESKEDFEKEMNRRLEVVEKQYRFKKSKLEFILERLKVL